MSAAFTKAKLLKELSDIAKVSNQRVEQILDALAEIAAREAANGVDVLGMCGLSNVGPTTAPIFSFKCPYCASVIEVPEDCAGQAADCPACHRAFTVPFPNKSQRAAMSAATAGEFISFLCKTCGQEIEAPAEMAGTSSECPGCGAAVIIPRESDPGTSQALSAVQASEEEIAAAKGRTIRIDLSEL